MSYIEENLMAGERTVYRAKLHWAVFAWPALLLLIAVLSFAGGGLEAGVLFVLIALVVGTYALVAYNSSEFGVTNRRVLAKVGLLSRRSFEILLAKVEGIGVNQSMLGRMLDYGTIVVSGTGGTKEHFNRIAAPFEFRKQVQEQIAAVQVIKQTV